MNDPLPIIIANLKANLTWDEISLWIDQVGQKAQAFKGTIVLCPSYPFLTPAFQKIKSFSLKLRLGSQDISKFERGPYTGEVAASQIASLCQYSIIGHSERRENFKESDQDLAKKVQNSKKFALEPIFCIQGTETKIPGGVTIVAYEPIFAIGTGNPDTPENAQKIAQIVKQKGEHAVIYGGSVSKNNAKQLISQGAINGLLVGTNSLDPQNFIQIIEAV